MLAEDIGSGDITTALFASDAEVVGEFRARSEGVVCGLQFVIRLFHLFDKDVSVRQVMQEGNDFEKDDVLLRASGRASSLLTVERTALNLLSRLCGIAARTARMAKLCSNAVLLDTRKTTPLLRSFEKYAVAVGGGVNHRNGLYDAVLVKDNHLSLLAGEEGDFVQLVAKARNKFGPEMVIEIEVDNLEQFKRVLKAKPDIILLDNMSCDMLREAVKIRNEQFGAKGVLLEASGGISIETVAGVDATGIDRISAGCLTYDPVIVDIGLDFVSND